MQDRIRRHRAGVGHLDREGLMGDYEDRVSGEGVGGEQQKLFGLEDVPDEKAQRIEELRAFLLRLKDRELDETLRKAAEYGSSDLEVMAQAMLLLVPEAQRDRRLGLQMAIGFYALGKVARLFGAFEDGRVPSADTWYDLHIYGVMGLRVHEEGKWL